MQLMTISGKDMYELPELKTEELHPDVNLGGEGFRVVHSCCPSGSRGSWSWQVRSAGRSTVGK